MRMSTLQEAIAAALDSNRSIASFQVAGATLVVFDTLLTLDREIRLIWASPWSPVKAVYLIQRYLPFIDTVTLNTYWYLGSSQDPSTCSHLQNVIAWTAFIGILLSEALMSFRVWAVWMRNRYMKVMLSDNSQSSYRLQDVQPPPSVEDIGCLDIPTNNLLYVCWACLAGYDTAAFIIMIMPLARAYHQGGTARMTRVIYEDGIKYYALLFLSSLLNIIIVTTQKNLLYLLTMYAPLMFTPSTVHPDTLSELASEGCFILSLRVA
ncbi:hypothetical protein PM082_014461 [Marasmius tenuissimus]|nr:hypothetical protein PM082_014461 [Marasmius tenuissimus]